MSSIYERTPADALRGYVELATGDPLKRVDADMRYVLDTLEKLGGRPIEMCLPTQARGQPLMGAALTKLLDLQNRGAREADGVVTEDLVIPGPAGDIPARIYRPAAAEQHRALPMLLYIHGGGWVLGTLDDHDATPREMASKTGAIVVSTHYRQAPEHKFPAAHEDTYAAWQWMTDNAAALGGDPRRAAVMGEGAGANMAMNIAIRARDERGRMPVHQVLVCPIAGNDLKRPSYVENMRARPLSTPMIQWFVRHAFDRREDMNDPRINLCERADLQGLPKTTLVLAEVDPLRSEGEALAQALQACGVDVDATTYEGVTYDFFGLGRLVNKAMFAQSQVTRNLHTAFVGLATSTRSR